MKMMKDVCPFTGVGVDGRTLRLVVITDFCF